MERFRPQKNNAKWWALAIVVVLLAGLLLYTVWYYRFREVTVAFDDPVELFKYGSIGSEEKEGVPLLIWEAMPDVCPDKLPGDDLTAFGFTVEPGQSQAIGTTNRTIGIPRVGVNCALCHTGTVREAADSEPEVVLGMPAQQLDLQGFTRFLWECAGDAEQFTADNVMAAIEQRHALSPIDSLVYRYIIIPTTITSVARLRDDFNWYDYASEFGPGRVDTFSRHKVQFGFEVDEGTAYGIVDFPSVWYQDLRDGLYLHWDGNNNSLFERNISAALTSGVTEESVNLPNLEGVAEWLRHLPPPAYPFGIDEEMAAAGESLYVEHCAGCHSFEGGGIGQVLALEDIGTDPNRADAFTQELVDNLHELGKGKPWQFSHFRTTDGYANMPLDGIWARAPYLHNGSVPTLRDLLEAPEKRPAVFYRGYDVYDPVNAGFVSSGPEAEASGFEFNTALEGNDNGGHLYGIDLNPEEKAALVEYLKSE
jgi:mono/diheme cytochrome c family protein